VKIVITGETKLLSNEILRFYTRSFLTKILPDNPQITINLILKNSYNKHNQKGQRNRGLMTWYVEKSKTFNVFLYKNRIDNFEELIYVLVHELVHVKQILNRFLGKSPYPKKFDNYNFNGVDGYELEAMIVGNKFTGVHHDL
jgi:hypothetical protein